MSSNSPHFKTLQQSKNNKPDLFTQMVHGAWTELRVYLGNLYKVTCAGSIQSSLKSPIHPLWNFHQGAVDREEGRKIW